MDESNVKYFNLSEDKSVLSVKVSENLINEWFENQRRKLSLFICLDISGSMAGSGLTQAKKAILYLLDSLFAGGVLSEKDVTCFFYQSSCEVVSFANNPNLRWENGGIQEYFDRVNSYGGTSFVSVFDSIIENVKTIDKDVAIIFFTDGQDGSGINQLKESKVRLEAALSVTSHSTEVHTIGFTRSHDAALLSWLTKVGNKEGNFQYVSESEKIVETMETTRKLLELNDLTLYVKLGDQEPLPTTFDDKGYGKFFLSGAATNVDGKKITILKDLESSKEYEISTLPSQIPANDPMAILLIISHIQFEITQMTNEVLSHKNDYVNKRKRLDEILEQANMYNEQLNSILETTFKSKSLNRSSTIQQIMEVKPVMHQFKNLLSEALKGTLNNEKIASFNDLAYKNITKRRLRNKLEDRAVKNIDLMEASEKKIEEFVKSIDFDELDSQESEDNKTKFTCLITTDNYIEAMKGGECICLALDVARSQAAIADPSLINIKAINQTFLSSGAFLDSIRFALNESFDAEDVHGGFKPASFIASIVHGVANENITGVFPLYINEKHWSIAKERMKPIFGYLTTLDMFGYSYAQVTTMLAKALNDTSTEFRRDQFKLILETCDAIYRQSNNLRKENINLFENYMKSPTNRTIDIVANNFVYLGHMLCALRCGDISIQDIKRWLQDGLIVYLVEELIRRRLNKFEVIENEMSNIEKVLGIDQKKYIDEPIKEYEASYDHYIKSMNEPDTTGYLRYSNAIRQALGDTDGIVHIESTEETTKTKMAIDPPTINIQLYGSNTYQIPDLNFIAIIKQSVNSSIETVLRFNKIFESLTVNSTNTIESILEIPEFQFTNNKTDLVNTFFKRYTPKVQLATFLQSFLHRQNSVRREAVESEPTKYYEPFSESTADIIISNSFNKYVTETLEQKSAAIIKTYSDLLSDEIGMAFWQCKDVEEAAGIILLDVKFRGHFIFARIIKALQRRGLSLAREKIEMVIYGNYKGVKLFKDEPKNPEDPENVTRFKESIVWSPSRKNVFRMLKAQKKDIPEIEYWLRVMPDKHTEYIKSYFERPGRNSFLD
ncbi:9300_t:CDS:2 [Cetraspora pellucida]|uniref:9300_t:CDS:1 n=1 Tax=Cetraspora pellucida TaxID=1433469 RepID=A0ACA9KL68_9GLOM|nr:9300_t:CDS:2 [Cetraspora pellucida]